MNYCGNKLIPKRQATLHEFNSLLKYLMIFSAKNMPKKYNRNKRKNYVFR